MKSEIAEASSLIATIYKYHGAGGHWHLVLDDQNIDDDSVRHCINYLEHNKNDGSDAGQIDAELKLGDIFIHLTEKERLDAIENA